ncbi:MAG: PhzF family phenazine biosynthesis protein [Balneolaceae bacterium]
MKNITSIETYIVDSFTDEPFKGNPAGVCILKQKLKDDTMLSIAGELGLSETAFITKTGRSNSYNIRYFSPVMEIPLCGHATLASSKIVFDKDDTLDEIRFHTIQDLDLQIQKDRDMIIMEFPVYETMPAEAPELLLKALGIDEILNCEYNEETKILLLEIEDSRYLSKLKPDFAALYRSHDSINGVLITAPSAREGFDFESRYFWPWSGTNEDPVTGGTHTFLTKYWSKRLGKTRMKSFQCSGRTGFMEVELIGNQKLLITSMASIIFEGRLRI